MDTTGYNAALIDVPTDDGSISRAMSELDAKITAWVNAVADAQRVIDGLSRLEKQAPASAAARATAASAAHVAVAAKETKAAKGAKDSKAPSGGDEQTKPVTGPNKSGLRVGHLTDNKPSRPAPVRKGILVYEEEAAAEPRKPAQESSEEDEALLATLDAQLARQIRIKRRLSNNTKSVRELLEAEKKGKRK
jgi:hypothetical protein